MPQKTKHIMELIPKFREIVEDLEIFYVLYQVYDVSFKNPSFLDEKFFTRCELQGTRCKFLEKRGKRRGKKIHILK